MYDLIFTDNYNRTSLEKTIKKVIFMLEMAAILKNSRHHFLEYCYA